MSSLQELLQLSASDQQARGLAHTPREIAQQPATWQQTLEIFRREQPEIQSFLERVGVRSALADRPVVMLVGAGTSDYIGHTLVPLLRQCWGCEVMACASTTLLTNAEDYIIPGRRYLWISFSRSGDSPEGVAVLEQACALYPEIAHLVVTCNANARMIQAISGAAASCVVVLADAVNDRSLVMTSSFTNMVIMGQCLAHAWSIDDYAPIEAELSRAASLFLESAPDLINGIADLGPDRVCFVGSGPLEGVARESALKVLEMTAGRVKTMHETVLGLRHGPMAALDRQTAFVCFVSSDPRRSRYARDLLVEIGQKGITQQRIAIGLASQQADFATACDHFLPLETSVSDLYRPVLDVTFGQLLGLSCSIHHGCKPDSPSPGGVITRVVQGFEIY